MFQQSSVACLSLLLQQPGGAASLEYKYIVISIEPKTKKQNNSKKEKKTFDFCSHAAKKCLNAMLFV